MFCKNCGKEVDDKAVICHNCGVLVGEVAVAEVETQKKVNGFGIAGFVIGILSFYFGVYFCVTPIIGLILNIIGMTRRKDCNSGSNGITIAGLVINIIALVIWGLVWLIVGAAIIAIISGS